MSFFDDDFTDFEPSEKKIKLFETPKEGTSVELVLERLSRIDFPHSLHSSDYVSKCVDFLKSYKLDIQPYRFITLNQLRAVPNQLGFIPLKKSDFEYSNLTCVYSWLEIAKSKRHDQTFSQYQVWQNEKPDILDRAIKSYRHYQEKAKSENISLLDQPLEIIENECYLRIKELGGPAFYPCMLVVGLLKHFKGNKVLDIASGWGDRLLAACLLGIEYVGADPNTKLIPIHSNLIKDFGDPLKHRVICQPFEDIVFEEKEFGTFDMMLSSPPFFNLELYSDESTQCSERYHSVSNWMNGYMLPSLKMARRLVKSGGFLVLHVNDIVDFKNPHNSIRIVEDIVKFLVQECKVRFLGQLGYAMAKLPKDPSVENKISSTEHSVAIPNFKREKAARQFNKLGVRTDRNGNILGQPLYVFQKNI